MKKTIIDCTIVTLLVFSATASADIKMYSGAECVANDTDQSDANYTMGRVLNDSSGYEGFHCPVVLDEHAVSESASTWIYLLDQNINGDIHCSLRSQSAVTTSYYFKSTTTSGASTTPVKKTLTGSTSYYTDGMRYIYCLVPGRQDFDASGITAYSVNEG